MVCRMSRVAISACLALVLAIVVAADLAEKGTPKRLRKSYSKGSSKTEERRNLKKKSKNGSRKVPPDSQRMVVKCDPAMGQDNCLELISSNGENIKIVHNLPGIHGFAIEVDESTRDDLMRMGVDLIEDYIRVPQNIQDSIHYHRDLQQDSSQTIPYGVDLINARQVWDDYGVRGQGVKVCVLDTGVYADHPDFASSNLSGYNGTEAVTPWDEDPRGHGTHITGIIAASDNNEGIVGVAPSAEIYMIRLLHNNGTFYGSDIVAAAEACRDAGANIISISLGGDRFQQGEYDIFEELYSEGILTVASAGNTGGPESVYPASYSMVVSVASCNQNKVFSGFSSFNSFVDIAAPGVAIMSTYNNGGYVSFSGTSMAAPHVTGVLALLLSYKPDASPAELVGVITETTQELSNSNKGQNNLDIGIIDALAAIQALEANYTVPSTDATCVLVELSLLSDQYGQETLYRLLRDSDGISLWYGDGLLNNHEYVESLCVAPTDCYQFDVRDRYGDGIIGQGIMLTYDGDIKFQGGEFGIGAYCRFGNGCV